MNDSQTSRDEHAKAWELLPWGVNGTLDEWSRGSIERHASDCLTCRKELELLREISEGMRSTDERPRSAERSLAALMERIDRREATASARLSGLFERFRPSRWAVASLQAIAVLLVVGAVGWLWSVGTAPRFRTLSTATESVVDSRPRLRVVFDDRLSVAEMGEILTTIRGHLVDGPSPHGVYTVEIESPPGGAAELSAVIERLREHEGVRFAEPLREGASGQLP